MKAKCWMMILLIFVSMLVACSQPAPTVAPTAAPPPTVESTPTPEPTATAEPPPTVEPTPTVAPTPAVAMLKPGDKIGDMVLKQVSAAWETENWLDGFCDIWNLGAEGPPPITVVRECSIPPVPELYLALGNTIERFLDVAYELYIDGEQIDLEAFGTFDIDPMRWYGVSLENLTPGAHTYRKIVSPAEVAPDAYELILHFTIASEEVALPTLPPTAVKGQHAYTSEEAQLDFLLYIPEDYGTDPQREWPLMMYLHGHVQGLAHIDLIVGRNLPEMVETEADFPFIVVSPLRDEGYLEYWYQDENVQPMFHLLEEIQELYAVDAKRIYLTGDSAGGNGCWEVGLQYPERFAALVPVSGYYGYPFEVPENICDLKDVPIWAFHGAKDDTIPLDAEQGLVEALQACGGKAQITVFPDAGHDVDVRQIYTEELIAWLLSQTLE